LFVFANLPWGFVYLWVTQSRKVRALIPIIPRKVKVTCAGQMSNDTSIFPVALLENAVTRPIAYQGEEVCGSPKRRVDEVPISNELFLFDL
jgi:hypothetical protein